MAEILSILWKEWEKSLESLFDIFLVNFHKDDCWDSWYCLCRRDIKDFSKKEIKISSEQIAHDIMLFERWIFPKDNGILYKSLVDKIKDYLFLYRSRNCSRFNMLVNEILSL